MLGLTLASIRESTVSIVVYGQNTKKIILYKYIVAMVLLCPRRRRGIS